MRFSHFKDNILSGATNVRGRLHNNQVGRLSFNNFLPTSVHHNVSLLYVNIARLGKRKIRAHLFFVFYTSFDASR